MANKFVIHVERRNIQGQGHGRNVNWQVDYANDHYKYYIDNCSTHGMPLDLGEVK